MKKAVIAVSGGTECFVDSLSEKGARIHLPGCREMPLEFYINIEGDERPRYCAVFRRGQGLLNVYFV